MNNEKTKGVIAYLFGFIGGLIVLLGFKDSKKSTKIHAAQAIVLSLAYLILDFAIAFVPIVNKFGWLLSTAYFVAVLIGIIKAYNLEEYDIPIISEQAKKIFSKQINEEVSKEQSSNEEEKNTETKSE